MGKKVFTGSNFTQSNAVDKVIKNEFGKPFYSIYDPSISY